MRDEEKGSGIKGSEILQQMHADAGSKKHLDQLKIRAEAAMKRAIEARNETAFVEALAALGIDATSEDGRMHVSRFRQLPPKR